MIAEIGLAALWLAAALAVLQMVSGGFALRSVEGAPNPMAIYARPAAVVQAVLAVLAFILLLYAFAVTDLSIKLVATNSHSMKPMIYKLTGTWGNHEGSMLLWVGVLALSGGLLAAFEKRLPERTMGATLGVQGFVALGFYAFLLFSSNPFERLPVPAVEGVGLNPLLQDIGLAIHPPTLYAGYVGLSVAFSLAMGALLTKEVNPSFARVMRPWVLGAWVLLTFGITAGSYWAYYELGWGGWWFWDPVENASLMPWLAATALMHSVSVLAARDALRTWTIMLGVLAFSMSMLGTFLVRSGVLTSVHAFAVDPERGAFILGLLGLYIGGAFTIFALRAGAVAEGKRFAATSREGALVFNNVMLSAILAIVLLGTLYPLLTEAFDVRVSVGPPYFNPAAAIFAVPMFLAALERGQARAHPVRDAAGGRGADRGDCPGELLRPVPAPADARPRAGGGAGSGGGAAAEGPQADPRAVGDMGHGARPFRRRGLAVRHGLRGCLHAGAPRSGGTGRHRAGRRFCGHLAERDPCGRPQLDRDRSAPRRQPERRRAGDSLTPGTQFLVAPASHQRKRSADPLERSALRGDRQSGRGRALADPRVVEAVRHLHLVWRIADRAGRRAGDCRAREGRCEAPQGDRYGRCPPRRS
jgi:hypothetical protein